MNARTNSTASRERHYAGIGSRSTPPDVLDLATAVARKLAASGWVLRSGHARGADQAFERGAGEDAEVFLPWRSFEGAEPLRARTVWTSPTPAAQELSREHHPAWSALRRGGRALHARNAHQILGRGLDSPVRFVIAWTPGGRLEGGTAQALRMAGAFAIPVFNLAIGADRQRVEAFLGC